MSATDTVRARFAGEGYHLEFTATAEALNCPSCGRHAPIADVIIESMLEVGRQVVSALACVFCGQRGTLLDDAAA